MNKIKATNKMVKGTNKIIITVNNLDSLLKCRQANYYNAGVYGWNYDAYVLDNVTIITGYRPFKTDIEVSFDLCNKYNNKALEVTKNNTNYEVIKNELELLLNEFLKEVLS